MMNLQENVNRIKEMMGLLNEDRYKGYKRFLRDYLFGFMPDYVFNDIFRETGDFRFSEVMNMSKQEMIDYFTKGPGRDIYDRWGGFKSKKPEVVEISWDDLTDEIKSFLKDKMSGEDERFPDSREKIERMKEKNPGLGFGENEPILIRYNEDGKIFDIPGGNHRLYSAFELNQFEPVLMKAYISQK